MNKLKGKTTSGFEFELDATVLDNMELVDALAEAENDNPIAVSNVCLLLLGKGTRKRLYDHLRNEDGRVPVEAVAKNIAEIFAGIGEQGKN